MIAVRQQKGGDVRRGVICLLMAMFTVLALLMTWAPYQLPDVVRQMLQQRPAGSARPATHAHNDGASQTIATILHPMDHVSRPPKQLKYEWIVTHDLRRPDGVMKDVYLINDQFPGPLIEARSGDTLVVEVQNHLTNGEGLSIHWHGLHQRGSLEMDGAVGFTQQPIAAGDNMTCEFQISGEQHGTFWYHAHDQVQRGDGLYGGLIVHQPSNDGVMYSDNFDYEQEELLMISDWYHRQAKDVMAWYQSADSFGNEPVPDSLLVNGKGAYNCSLAVVARPVDCVQIAQADTLLLNAPSPGRYRYRIVNTGTLAGISVLFGQGEASVIQVDGGHPVADNLAHQVGILHPGERMDVVVTWSSDASFLRIVLDEESFRYPNSALETIHTIPVVMASQAVSPAPIDTITTTDLSSLLSFNASEVPAEADITIVVYATSAKLAHLDNVPTGFLNHTTWKPSAEPLVTLPRDSWDEHQLVPFIPLQDDSQALWVDVVINNLDDGAHPFHLHGHDFYVLHSHKGGSYWGSYNPFEDTEMIGGGEYNTLNPVKKDTFSVPSRGFAVIRFRADNPGIWLFHCHVMWHLGSGMAMGFHVGQDEANTG